MNPGVLKYYLAVLFACSTLACNVDVYFWQDNNGKSHYSDRYRRGSTSIKLRADVAWRRIEKVLDGDTLILAGDEKVRLLGINAPEVERYEKFGEPLGKEAKAYLQSVLVEKKVRLESDISKFDKYQRKLAHVFTDDGIHINLKMVEKGFAIVNIHPPNLNYTKSLILAQQQAEIKTIGIWGDAYYQSQPINSIGKNFKRRWYRLVGVPQHIKKGRRYNRLIFSDRFDVRIHHDNLQYFPDISDYLMKSIEVRGWVSRRGEQLSILVRHPSALIP